MNIINEHHYQEKDMYAGLNSRKSTLGEEPIADYYGPPRPGQSYNMYNEYMKTPFYTVGGAVVGALVAGPIGAVVGGIGSWLLSSNAVKNKSKVQGG